MNSLAAFAQQTALPGDPISTQLCLHSRLNPLFLESTRKKKKKRKKLKDAHNVAQVLLSLRAFKPVKFCFIVLYLCR